MVAVTSDEEGQPPAAAGVRPEPATAPASCGLRLNEVVVPQRPRTGLAVNLIAVDYYDQGTLLAVVRTLNRQLIRIAHRERRG